MYAQRLLPGRLDLVAVLESTLGANLVHDLHLDQRVLEGLTLGQSLLAVAETASRCIGLVEETVKRGGEEKNTRTGAHCQHDQPEPVRLPRCMLHSPEARNGVLAHLALLAPQLDVELLRVLWPARDNDIALLALDQHRVGWRRVDVEASRSDALRADLRVVANDGGGVVNASQRRLEEAGGDLRVGELVVRVLVEGHELPSDRVDTEVEEGSATDGGVVQPGLGVLGEHLGQVGVDADEVTEDPLLVDQPEDLLHGGDEASPDGLHKEEVLCSGESVA